MTTRTYASLEESQKRGRAKQTGRWRGDVEHFACGHECSERNTVYKYGHGRCRICLDERQMPVAEERPFKCGHPRAPDNIQMCSGSARCKVCHQARARQWHNPKNPIKPLYENPPCALAQTWTGPARVAGWADRAIREDGPGFGSRLRASMTPPDDYANMVRIRDEARSEKRRRYAKPEGRAA